MINEQLSPALGKITSGMYILTGNTSDGPIGMLASFIEQAAFQPPMITVSLGADRPLRQVLDKTGLFGLNILSKSNTALMKPFARRDVANPFDSLTLVENSHRLPQLADAWAFLACRVASSLSAGDHILYLAEVLDGTLQRADQEPMVRVRSNGFAY